MSNLQTENKKEVSECKQFRMKIGKDILVSMNENDDLPLPNIRRLARTMQEYFKREGMIDQLKEEGYKWVPTVDYWLTHMSDLCGYMREDSLYFGYLRERGTFKGIWKFMEEEEWKSVMMRDHVDIGTRIDNHNDKLSDSSKTWNLELPGLPKAPPLLN